VLCFFCFLSHSLFPFFFLLFFLTFFTLRWTRAIFILSFTMEWEEREESTIDLLPLVIVHEHQRISLYTIWHFFSVGPLTFKLVVNVMLQSSIFHFEIVTNCVIKLNWNSVWCMNTLLQSGSKQK